MRDGDTLLGLVHRCDRDGPPVGGNRQRDPSDIGRIAIDERPPDGGRIVRRIAVGGDELLELLLVLRDQSFLLGIRELLVESDEGQVGPLFAKYKKKRSEEHTSELQSLAYLVCRLLLEKKNK